MPSYSEMLHVGPENIEEGTGRLFNARPAKDIGLISGKYLFDAADVLYSKIRPYLRKAALPEFAGICSADMYPLRPVNGSLSREFLYCYLLSEKFTTQAIGYQDRTGIPKLNRNQLNSLLVALPPMDEQKFISDALIGCDLSL